MKNILKLIEKDKNIVSKSIYRDYNFFRIQTLQSHKQYCERCPYMDEHRECLQKQMKVEFVYSCHIWFKRQDFTPEIFKRS